ncbi:DUF2617 family protein [Streptomyces sodiiphilus]|uniref:DUF2617 family protein n=1 Tax=Streptomyces sodiiphilus TaxID=226217 RepID=A0ABN2P001_9ACTN
MLTTLQTAYTDTRAADLAWALDLEPLPALAALDLQLGENHVQLRVIGASHQVFLDAAEGSFSETVACMAGSSTPLPLGVSRRLDRFEYEFAARIEHLGGGSFAGRAQELLALVADHPSGLVGTFPGDPHAFTALLAQRCGEQIHWRTWHAYPQERQLVATRTRIGLPGRPPAGARAGGRCDAAATPRVRKAVGSQEAARRPVYHSGG